MKKYIILLISILSLPYISFADVSLETDMGKRFFADGSTLNINAERDIDIRFYNAKIFVPKGEKITIKCLIEDERPFVYFVGDGFKNTYIGNDKYTAYEYSIFKVDVFSSNAVLLKGKMSVTDPHENTTFLKQQSVYDVDIFIDQDFSAVDFDSIKKNKQIDRDILTRSAPHFMVRQDINYNDNIYLSEKDNVPSFISSTQLFGKYTTILPYMDTRFNGTANIGYNAYSENYKNNYFNTGIDLNADNDFFDVRGNFIYTEEPENNSLTTRTKRNTNIVKFDTAYSLNHNFDIEFTLKDIYNRYIDNDFSYLNRNRINLGLNLCYNLTNETVLSIGYLFTSIRYYDNTASNSSGNSFIFAASKDFSSKLKAKAQISYDGRKYNKDYKNSSNTGNITGFFISMLYTANVADSFYFTAQRMMEETLFESNRYYRSTSANISFKHKFYTDWEFNLLAVFELLEYPEITDGTERTDHFFKLRPEISCHISRHFSVGAWYQLQNKDSNYRLQSYENNRLGMFIKYML